MLRRFTLFFLCFSIVGFARAASTEQNTQNQSTHIHVRIREISSERSLKYDSEGFVLGLSADGFDIDHQFNETIGNNVIKSTGDYPGSKRLTMDSICEDSAGEWHAALGSNNDDTLCKAQRVFSRTESAACVPYKTAWRVNHLASFYE